MASNDNINKFRYFPFLKKLVTTGQVSWETPENGTETRLITRLYIDGDMIYWHPANEDDMPLEIAEELRMEHAKKINRDLASINTLAGHLGLAVAFLTVLLGWLFNPEHFLEQTIVVAVLSAVGYLTRKVTFPAIFKIVGAIVSVFAGKR